MEKGDIRITGSGKHSGGTFRIIDITGSGKFMGDVNADETYVSGSGKFEQNLFSDTLEVTGLCRCYGDIKSKSIEVNGNLKSERGVIYSDRIVVNGMLKNEGEINADKIEVNGSIRANQLMGEEIVIQMFNSINRLFIRQFDLNKAETIECTKLQAAYLKCTSISAHEIVLMNHCKVETIYCDGTLSLDASCEVKNIEGDCRIINL